MGCKENFLIKIYIKSKHFPAYFGRKVYLFGSARFWKPRNGSAMLPQLKSFPVPPAWAAPYTDCGNMNVAFLESFSRVISFCM